MADTHHYVTEYDLLVTVLVYPRWLDRRMIHNSGLDKRTASLPPPPLKKKEEEKEPAQYQ